MRLLLANNILPLLLSIHIPKLDGLPAFPYILSSLSTGRNVALDVLDRAAFLWECQHPPTPVGPSGPPSFNDSASFYLNDRLITVNDTSSTPIDSADATHKISVKVHKALSVSIFIPAPAPPLVARTSASPSPIDPNSAQQLSGLVPQPLVISISAPAPAPPLAPASPLSMQASCPPPPPPTTQATCLSPNLLSPPATTIVMVYPPTLLIAVLSLLCGVFGTPLCALIFSQSCRNAFFRAFDEARFEDKCSKFKTKCVLQEEEEVSYNWTELVKPWHAPTLDSDAKQRDPIELERRSSVPSSDAEHNVVSTGLRECSSSPISAGRDRSQNKEITGGSPVSDYLCMATFNRPACPEPVSISSSSAPRNYLPAMAAEDGEDIEDSQGSPEEFTGSEITVDKSAALARSPALGDVSSGTRESSCALCGSCSPGESSGSAASRNESPLSGSRDGSSVANEVSSAMSVPCSPVEESSADVVNNSATAITPVMSITWTPEVVSESLQVSSPTNQDSQGSLEEPTGGSPVSLEEPSTCVLSAVDDGLSSVAHELASATAASCSPVEDSPASGDCSVTSDAPGTAPKDPISSSEEQEATLSKLWHFDVPHDSIFGRQPSIFDLPPPVLFAPVAATALLSSHRAKRTSSCVNIDTLNVFGCPSESRAPTGDLDVTFHYPTPLIPDFRFSMKTPSSPTPVPRKISSLQRRTLHNRSVSHPVPLATPAIVSQESGYAEILEKVKKTSERCEALKKEADEFLERIDARKTRKTQEDVSKENQPTEQVDACAPRHCLVPRFTLEHCAPVLPSSSMILQDPPPDDFSVDVFRSNKPPQSFSPVLDPEIRKKKIGEVGERIDAIKRRHLEEHERWNAELLEMNARSMRRAEEDKRKEEQKQRRKEMEREEGTRMKERATSKVAVHRRSGSIKDLPMNSTDNFLATKFDPARSSSPRSRSIRRKSIVQAISSV